MSVTCRNLWIAWVLAAADVFLPGGTDRHAQAQVGIERPLGRPRLDLIDDRQARAQVGSFLPDSRFELAEGVQLDRAESTVLADLERVKAYLSDRQWDEAVETLQQLMESSADKLLGVTEQRYVSLRDWCQLQLAALPPAALQLYRSRVDPLARRWYEEGVARRDRKSLQNVVQQAFASSWGDDALLALGEMALESGDCASARWYWERIIPSRPPADTAPTWPGYPDSDLDLAAVRARLVLVSILESSADRARDELAQLRRLHAEARGRWGGREVNYAEALAALLSESAAWPRPTPGPDWPTLAGSPSRNAAAPPLVDTADVAWRIPLPAVKPAANAAAAAVAEDANAPLSYHPLLVGDLLLLNTQLEIRALRAASGRPAWGGSNGVIFRDLPEGTAGEIPNPADTLGTARLTMTACHGKLYARMGSAVTSRPQESPPGSGGGYLVCLDLGGEGRLLWKVAAEPGWAFEGSPAADGASVYVALRHSEIRPQAHVACLDAQTGRLRWRRFVCAAETPARGLLHQSTHNLLTLRRDTLYYNTNLGAVAALRVDDGRLQWVTLYPRARQGDLAKPAPHWQRDLNPCLYHRGTLLAAPADSPRIFALDAASGQILWQTGTEVEDVVHLLGATNQCLIASGRKLYWIGLTEEDKGRLKHVWPEGHEKPGYGRGLLAGDAVLFPTRQMIYVFDQKTAQPRKVIDLRPHGITGGNLLVAGEELLIATGTELIALGRYGQKPKPKPSDVAMQGKGDRHLLCEAPDGPFRQKVPVTFSRQ
jgi:outer membrane protein assembly factor BamB